MGGLCFKGATVENVPSSGHSQTNGIVVISNSGLGFESDSLSHKEIKGSMPESKQLREPFEAGPCSDGMRMNANSCGVNPGDEIYDGIPRLSRVSSDNSRSTKSKQVAVAKVSDVGSLFGKAGSVGLGKAVEVLDTLGSSMTSLHHSGGFVSGVTTKGDKISILAFEVANTIVKGANLMESLSKENVRHLKEVVLQSSGVQKLISKDINELQRIAAADKREELKVFAGEIVRFGNRCKDPQYHNLDRYFETLATQLTPQKQLKEKSEAIMWQLMTSVQHTAELYHELHALDRYEQDYRRKLQEEDNPKTAQKGDGLAIIRAELKSQRKTVRSLKKKSLWSKIMEEVMEKLVDIVNHLYLEIHEAFGSADAEKPVKASTNNHQKLGSAGLALHYANIITQIDTLVSRSSSVPPNSRDALYQGLPPNVKLAFRSKLQSFQLKEELTAAQIKVEMEKTLYWLVPIAANTTKAHHGFGWVGEWANTGSDVTQKQAGQTTLLRIETLYHADKDKTETHILDLVVWLHHLITQTRASTTNGGPRSPVKSPIRSPNSQKTAPKKVTLSAEDRLMLRDVTKRKLTPGISKSQEFDTVKTANRSRLTKYHRVSRSNNHSPNTSMEIKREIYSTKRPSSVSIIDFDIDRIKALDVIDRVDTLHTLRSL